MITELSRSIRHDDLGNVVFPCGFTVDADGDGLNLYYGAADTSLALAHGSTRQLLGWLRRNGSPDVGGSGNRRMR